MTTKLELINRVLVNAHERVLTASTQPLGNIVSNSIDEALIEVSTSTQWTDLRRTTVASSWTDNVANISASEIFKISEVRTGVVPSRFVPKEEFELQSEYSYTGTSGQVQYWTYETSQTVKCNPYPTDNTAQANVKFVYHIIPSQPSTDSGVYTLSERFLKLIEMKASSMFCFRYLSDLKSYQVYQSEYERLRLRLLASDTGIPPQGYNMYRGNRRHY
jgi:hypothetical protein